MVDHISSRYDQQLKLSQNCQKYEREEDELIEARISSSIGIAFARYKLYYNIQLKIYFSIYKLQNCKLHP